MVAHTLKNGVFINQQNPLPFDREALPTALGLSQAIWNLIKHVL